MSCSICLAKELSDSYLEVWVEGTVFGASIGPMDFNGMRKKRALATLCAAHHAELQDFLAKKLDKDKP